MLDFSQFAKNLNDFIFSQYLVYLLLFTGVYFSVRTRFVQMRKIKLMTKLLFKGGDSDKGISPFQAFSIAVAGRVGTGNIAGVAGAIAAGGPGALFWMWALTLLGASSALVESILGQVYKEEIEGEFRGGPAYYFERALGNKVFGIVFAIITLISMGILLPGSQVNSIAQAVQGGFFAGAENVNLVKTLIGVFVASLMAFIVFGGTKRLGRVAEVIVPFMSFAYMGIALIIIIMNFGKLPEVFGMIFDSAFNLKAGFGGLFGHTIMTGVKRGIYSNEAGQGSGPHAASAAAVKHPAEQGLVQAFSVYFDTILVCTATGLMILIANTYRLTGDFVNHAVASGQDLGGAGSDIQAGVAFTQEAVATLLGPSLGYKFVAVALFFFAFTTIMAYYYMAESNIIYLSRHFKNKNLATILRGVVKVVFLGVIVALAAPNATAAFNLADAGVGIMAWYNVIGILILANTALKVLKDYETKVASGDKTPDFYPEELGITNTEVWKKR